MKVKYISQLDMSYVCVHCDIDLGDMTFIDIHPIVLHMSPLIYWNNSD